MPLALTPPLDDKLAYLGDQITHALKYLSENATTPLEQAVLSSAMLLCQRLPDLKDPQGVVACPTEFFRLRKVSAGEPITALRYLHAEAMRHDLAVTGYVLSQTLGLWSIARMIHLDGKPG